MSEYQEHDRATAPHRPTKVPAPHHNSFDGEVHPGGTVNQYGHVEGNVLNIHYGASFPVPPRGYPAAPVPMVNRDDDVETLTREVRKKLALREPPLFVVHGEEGVGKTSAISRWAPTVDPDFPDGTPYCNVAGISADGVPDTGDVLRFLLRAIGDDARHWPTDTPSLQSRWRSVVAGKRYLIILDNLDEPAVFNEVRPNTSSSAVIAISRYRPVEFTALGAELIGIDPLSERHCIDLLASFCPEQVAADQLGAQAIIRSHNRRPAPIRMVGATLRCKPTLSLTEGHREVLGSSSATQKAQTLVSEHLRAVLSDPQRRLLDALAAHPGPDFSARLAGYLNDTDAQDTLEELCREDILCKAGSARYKLSDTVRRFYSVTNRYDPTAFDRIARYYLESSQACDVQIMGPDRLLIQKRITDVSAWSYQPASAADSSNWLVAEQHNIVAVMSRAFDIGQYTTAWSLEETACWVMNQAYRSRETAAQTATMGITAARRDGNGQAEARMRAKYANLLLRTQEFDTAQTEIDSALALARGSENSRLVASMFEFQAVLLMRQHRQEEAIPFLLEALETNQRLDLPRAIAIQRRLLGECYLALGDLTAAHAQLTAALDVFSSGASSRHKGRTLKALSKLAAARGDTSEAFERLQDTIQALEQAGACGYIPEAYSEVGDALSRSGSGDLAMECWRKGLDYLARHDNGNSRMAEQLNEKLQSGQAPGSRSA